MAAVRYYVVTQEREVVVEAVDPAEAIHLASGVLGTSARSEPLGKPFGSAIKVTELRAREEY